MVEHIASGYETKLTAKQKKLIEEVVANRMENMFGDSETIERICREKPSLAKRIWERIKALIDNLGQTSSEREEIKKLRETERLFRAALETGGQDYLRGEMEETQRSGKTPVVEINISDDEARKFNSLSETERSKYIYAYLVENHLNDVFKLNDGITAIVDKKDFDKFTHTKYVPKLSKR